MHILAFGRNTSNLSTKIDGSHHAEFNGFYAMLGDNGGFIVRFYEWPTIGHRTANKKQRQTFDGTIGCASDVCLGRVHLSPGATGLTHLAIAVQSDARMIGYRYFPI